MPNLCSDYLFDYLLAEGKEGNPVKPVKSRLPGNEKMEARGLEPLTFRV